MATVNARYVLPTCIQQSHFWSYSETNDNEKPIAYHTPLCKKCWKRERTFLKLLSEASQRCPSCDLINLGLPNHRHTKFSICTICSYEVCLTCFMPHENSKICRSCYKQCMCGRVITGYQAITVASQSNVPETSYFQCGGCDLPVCYTCISHVPPVSHNFIPLCIRCLH